VSGGSGPGTSSRPLALPDSVIQITIFATQAVFYGLDVNLSDPASFKTL
jgi:hypothetical protein